MAWENSGAIDHESLYKASYGSMPDESVYDDGMSGIQITRIGDDLMMKNEAFTKAVNVGSASGAAGYAFTPIVWDQDVIDITRKVTPIITLIPKVTNKGKTANYYRVTARGAATWGSEDPALNEADDTRESVSVDMKYLRVTGRVTGVAQIAGAHFENSMQREVINKTQSLNEAIEEEILRGTNTASYGHDGLAQQLAPSGDAQGTTDLGAAITLSDVRELVSKCFVAKGAPNLLITDPFTADALIEQQMDYVRNIDPVKTVAWGLETATIQSVVGKIPVIPSLFMPTSTGSREIFCVNTNYLQQRVLQDITFQRVPTGGDSEKFLLKTYRTFVNKFNAGMGMIGGIDA